MTKGKIKKKNRGAWIVAPDGHRVGRLGLGVTGEDIEAARLVGATGAEMVERSYHGHLDQLGVPRDGREIEITTETTGIKLPTGWSLATDDEIAHRIAVHRAQLVVLDSMIMPGTDVRYSGGPQLLAEAAIDLVGLIITGLDAEPGHEDHDHLGEFREAIQAKLDLVVGPS